MSRKPKLGLWSILPLSVLLLIGVAASALIATVVVAEELAQLPPYHQRMVEKYSYVVSDADGRFYVHATPPDAAGGSEGITKAYRVTDDGDDKLLATYEWYARPRTVILCGNPSTNTLAVVTHVRASGRDIQNVEDRTVLKFFGGGTRLADYGVHDLAELGARIKQLSPEPFYKQEYKVQGCTKINEDLYVFTLRTFDHKQINFDIESGEVVRQDSEQPEPR